MGEEKVTLAPSQNVKAPVLEVIVGVTSASTLITMGTVNFPLEQVVSPTS